MLNIKGLSCKYGKVEVFKDLNASLPSKGLVLVKGESGSGKTSLLQIIAGMKKPSKGCIIFNNKKVRNRTKFRKNYISYINQTHDYIENISLRDNLKLVSKLNKKTYDESYCRELLNKLNLSYELDRISSSLSGGEKQRFNLALELVADKPILVLDEPTASLDSFNKQVVISILNDLSKDHLVILSTHDEIVSSNYIELMDSNVDVSIKSDNAYIMRNKVLNLSIKDKIMKLKRLYIGTLATIGFTLTFLAIYMTCYIPTKENLSLIDNDAYSIKSIDKNTKDKIVVDLLSKGDAYGVTRRTFTCSPYECYVRPSVYVKIDIKKLGFSNSIYEYDDDLLLNHDFIIGQYPKTAYDIVIGRKLADKIIEVTKEITSYDDVIKGYFGNEKICGISKKETMCIYRQPTYIHSINSLIGNKNYTVGSIKYEKYTLLYGDEILEEDHDKSIVLNQYYLDYDTEKYKDIYENYKSRFKYVAIAEFEDNNFETLKSKNYWASTISPQIESINDDINLVDGRKPEKCNEVVVYKYAPIKIGDNYEGYTVVGYHDDKDNRNSFYSTSNGQTYERYLRGSGESYISVSDPKVLSDIPNATFELVGDYYAYVDLSISFFKPRVITYILAVVVSFGIMLLLNFISIDKHNVLALKIKGEGKLSIMKNIISSNVSMLVSYFGSILFALITYVVGMSLHILLPNVFVSYLIWAALLIQLVIYFVGLYIPLFIMYKRAL